MFLASLAFSMLCPSMGSRIHHGIESDQISRVVVAYVQDWEGSPLNPDQLDYAKITHLDVAFANPVDASGTLSIPSHLAQLVDKAHQNGVKVLISIGGGGISESEAERKKYFNLINGNARAGFVQKISEYMDANKLDGLDVDLEGPAINQDYTAFVSALSQALKPRGKILTAAVSGGFGGDQITADALANFDLVNVMAYDASGPWQPNQPGPHSSFDFAKSCVTYWQGRGVPNNKIVLGVPFYGYGFGQAFTQDGYTYAQIVAKYPGSELVDQVAKTIYYNGIPTMRAKAKYVMDQNLAGVMIWSLDQDAIGSLSLLSAIHDAFLKH